MTTTVEKISQDNAVLTLRVSEARPKDVGRGIARIDPADMVGLGVEVGDIVRIEGKRNTVAKVMPAYPEDRGKGIIQIDGLIRLNAQTGLDEKVSVGKTSYKAGQRVALTPTTLFTAGALDTRYISSVLDGIPVVEGDKIRANLFGAKGQEFTVVTVIPREAIVINQKTIIEIRAADKKALERARVTYEDIGGHKKTIQRIREMIELPLR
ncbi:MAG: AAA family ATPase, partial [Deltaproteobacteria bacterium]